MRVIAGSARGTRLVAPRGMQTRPTADRVREALFSILQCRCNLEGARVLDICAGTGAMGIEALSRGAASCCFIENDRNAQASLKTNSLAARCADRAELLEMDAPRALRLLAGRNSCFDIVFFDPPYASGLYKIIPEALIELSLLADHGLLVTESQSRNILPERIGCLIKVDRRVYGDTALDLYVLEEA